MTIWENRDLPVLAHLLTDPPQHGMLWVDTRSEQPHPGLPELTGTDVYLAVLTLFDAGFVTWTHTEGEGGGNRHFQDIMVTGTGKQALGLWPRFDALGSPAALASVLDSLAEDAATEEERSNLRRAASVVRRSAPELIKAGLAGALSALARSQLGI